MHPALVGKTPLEAMDVIISEAATKGLLILLDNHRCWRSGTANRPNVMGADLKNEPHGQATWGDGTATDWRRAAGAGNAVLANAPAWLIVVEGTSGPVPDQQLPSHWWGPRGSSTSVP